MNDFILTQTKEVITTFEKTVTVITEKLETVDALGRKQAQKVVCSEQVAYHRRNPIHGDENNRH